MFVLIDIIHHSSLPIPQSEIVTRKLVLVCGTVSWSSHKDELLLPPISDSLVLLTDLNMLRTGQ